jgi:protein-S-isoprenylcysteine O-methyltransferase Ste14
MVGAAMLLLKAVLFTTAVAGSLVVLVPWLLMADADPARILPAARHAGWPLVAAGVAMVAWCAWSFARRGKGTPAPMDPPRELVAHGLFRFTRNPMYVGVLAAILGEALAFWSRPLLYHALGTFACVHLFVVCYEEPGLERRFGDAYRHYRRRVPRWLGWPRREEAGG